MSEFAAPVLEIVNAIASPAQKYLNYHRKFKKYVDNFREARGDLQVRKADIQQKLQDELCFGKRPKEEVEKWLEKVGKKTTCSQEVEDKVNNGKFLFRSCLGKLVDEATQEIKKVHAEGDFSGSLVVNDSSTAKLKLPTEEIEEAAEVEKIYKYLMGDEVRKIGVWGMGGIGKTTIMKHVHNKLEETKFGKSIWILVSQNFDIEKLQQKIACQLEETPSDRGNPTIRAAKLSKMLEKRGSYVLILDDVWRSFSLAEVGIPEPTAENGCKLVLTTRSLRVVRSMSCKEVQVTRLWMDKALQLILSKVGQEWRLKTRQISWLRRGWNWLGK